MFCVSPTANPSNSPLGSNVIAPSALMVNKPPVDPATAAPTVPPATALTVMTSLVSTSLSAPLPLSDITLPL